MTVSVIIVAHDEIGSVLLSTAARMLGELPLPTTAVSVDYSNDPTELVDKLQNLIDSIDHGQGVLVLTDLFGSTPSNIAQQISCGDNRRVVSGLNLSMIIRVMNYPDLTLDALVEKAVSGGREGVIDCS